MSDTEKILLLPSDIREGVQDMHSGKLSLYRPDVRFDRALENKVYVFAADGVRLTKVVPSSVQKKWNVDPRHHVDISLRVLMDNSPDGIGAEKRYGFEIRAYTGTNMRRGLRDDLALASYHKPVLLTGDDVYHWLYHNGFRDHEPAVRALEHVRDLRDGIDGFRLHHLDWV